MLTDIMLLILLLPICDYYAFSGSSDDGTKIERKHTFPVHNWSADRAPQKKSQSKRDFDEAAADGALPQAWPPTGPIPWVWVSLLDMLGWGEMFKQTDFNC